MLKRFLNWNNGQCLMVSALILIFIFSPTQSLVDSAITVHHETNFPPPTTQLDLIVKENFTYSSSMKSNQIYKRAKRFALDTLGAASGIMTAWDFFANKIKTDENMQEILITLAKMKSKFDSIESTIGIEHAKTKLFGSERNIKNCLRSIEDYTRKNIPHYQQKVGDNCNGVEDALDAIISSLLGGSGSTGSDLLEVIYEDVKGHRRPFNEKVDSFFKLVAIGVGLLPTYFESIGLPSSEIAHKKRNLAEEDKKLQKRFQEYTKNKILSENQVATEVTRLLEENRYKSNKDLSSVIFHKISNRWDLKLWFVAVYDHHSHGFDHHTVSGKFHHIIRVAGKYVILRGINPANQWTHSMKNDIESKVSQFCNFHTEIGQWYSNVNYGCWWCSKTYLRRCYHHKANAIWDELQKFYFPARDTYPVAVLPVECNVQWFSNIGPFVDFELNSREDKDGERPPPYVSMSPWAVNHSYMSKSSNKNILVLP